MMVSSDHAPYGCDINTFFIYKPIPDKAVIKADSGEPICFFRLKILRTLKLIIFVSHENSKP